MGAAEAPSAPQQPQAWHSPRQHSRAGPNGSPARLVAEPCRLGASMGCPRPLPVRLGVDLAAATPDSSPSTRPRLESPPELFLDAGTCQQRGRRGGGTWQVGWASRHSPRLLQASQPPKGRWGPSLKAQPGPSTSRRDEHPPRAPRWWPSQPHAVRPGVQLNPVLPPQANGRLPLLELSRVAVGSHSDQMFLLEKQSNAATRGKSSLGE